MNRRRSVRRTRLLAAGCIAALAGGLGLAGTAFAYFSGAGNGSGSAGTGNVQAVVLSPATVASQIYPGGLSTVAVTVTNPNPGRVRVLSLALDTTQGTGGFTVDASHSSCSLSSLSYVTQTNGGSGWTVQGGGSSSVALVNALSMSANAPSACQGASFTVYLKAGA